MDKGIVRSEVLDYIKNVKSALDSLTFRDSILNIVEVLLEAYEKGNRVFSFGNGGSGCLASHLVQDLNKHTIVGDDKSKVVVHKRFKAICLNESVSTMTTWANDVGYDRVFSGQLINLVEPWDIVIGITGSGNTPNVIKALEIAKTKGAIPIAFTGGGKVLEITQYALIIESDVNYCIEDALSCAVHIITDVIRNEIQK